MGLKLIGYWSSQIYLYTKCKLCIIYSKGLCKKQPYLRRGIITINKIHDLWSIDIGEKKSGCV